MRLTVFGFFEEVLEKIRTKSSPKGSADHSQKFDSKIK